MDDVRKMQLGQVVDYVVAYNERQEQIEKAQEREQRAPKKRKATQDDINAFFG